MAATNPITIAEWAKSQREGWLCKLYGEDTTAGRRRLHPESRQSQLVGMLEDLLLEICTVSQAVESTEQLVLADPGTLFANFTGIYFSAVLFFAGEGTTKLLVEYIVALASLPDAINRGRGPIVMDLGGNRRYAIEPGEGIDPGDGKLWRTLPGFSMWITEEFQGPEAYLAHLSTPDTPEVAKQKWRNFNAWLVMATTNRDAQDIPALRLGHQGPKALALALEHSPNTRTGRNVELHLPAAVLWMRNAEEEIKAVCCAGSTQLWVAGDLWAAVSGDVEDAMLFTEARFEFWRSRLAELGY